MSDDRELAWTDWRGGECPLAHDEPVAVRWRNGNMWTALAAGFQWHHGTEPRDFDIVAYATKSLPCGDMGE